MSEESNNDRDEETKDYENLEEKNGRPISESKAISAQQDRKRRYKQKTNIAGNSNKNRNLKKKNLHVPQKLHGDVWVGSKLISKSGHCLVKNANE